MSKFNTSVAIVMLSLGVIVPNQLTLATEKSPNLQQTPQLSYQLGAANNNYEIKNKEKSVDGHTVGQNRSVVLALNSSSNLDFGKPISRDKVRLIIESAAKKYDVDVDLLLAVASCESKLDPKKRGDGGESFGLWQIHLPDHPDITKEQALNPYWSTEWSVNQISKGNGDLWTCYKKTILSAGGWE